MNQQIQKGFSQSTLKFFVRHMAQASGRQIEREQKLTGLNSQIALLKQTARAPKPNSKKLEVGLEELDRRIKEIINEERLLVVNQQKEERIIEELKERIDLLEEKIQGLGHVHSITSDEHINRIDDMGKKLADVLARVAEKKERLKTAEYIPDRIITQINEINGKKRNDIKNLQAMIDNAERAHEELKKKKVAKEHLDSLKKTIDRHKKRLEELRA
ncbi:MAG: hypothetical protein KKE20_04975 [Nanoarchaeota archaeon]|nr:hypothetical protein [Nanoarchaeota archaeon]